MDQLENSVNAIPRQVNDTFLTADQKALMHSMSSSGSRLLHLSVAYNSLGPQGTTNLITALPSASLHHLNITSSLEDKGSQSVIQSMVEFMEVCHCKCFYCMCLVLRW